MSERRIMLLSLLKDGSDVILEFKSATGEVEAVPAHSLILRQWSEVLSAVPGLRDRDPHSSSSSSSSSHKKPIRIPMDGTNKEDWLLAMALIYPVRPPQAITWDNVEVLVKLGDKYGMPAFLQRFSSFLEFRMEDLVLLPNSKLFLWNWIFTADRYCMPGTAKALINSQAYAADLMGACPQNRLHELSSGTLQYLVQKMAGWLVKPGRGYCAMCKKVLQLKGGSGNHPICSICNRIISMP